MYQQEQVERGIALLDEKKHNWREKFVPAALEMSWYTTCILGQVYGGYENGLWFLGISHEQAPAYGFELPTMPSNPRERGLNMSKYRDLGETRKALVPDLRPSGVV